MGTKAYFRKFVLTGLLGASLAFLFGATFLRTEFQQAFLETSSNQLVAFYWGIVGGYLGPLFVISGLAPSARLDSIRRVPIA